MQARRRPTRARRRPTRELRRPMPVPHRTPAAEATRPRTELLPPEHLPRVVLEVAHELLHVVVDLFVHHEGADAALALLDVRDDRLRVRGCRVRALGELRD